MENIKNLELIELDLPQLILDKLLESGINLQNIKTNSINTFSDPYYHSYRRDYPRHGLTANFVMIAK